MKLVLGSHSPRRQAILKELGFEFSVVPSHVDETLPVDMHVQKITEHLAQKKNDALQHMDLGDCILITADTLVSANGRVLEKPVSPEECVEMLKTISGKTARAYTSVVITNTSTKKSVNFSDVATITFDKLPHDLINALAPHFFERGVAGGFDVGEPLLKPYVHIAGDTTTVRGLPKEKTRQGIAAVA